MPTDRQTPQVIITQPRPSTELRTPRTARFAEATAVYSPIEPSEKSNPFVDPPTNHYLPTAQPSDVGFGYMKEQHISVEMEETDPRYLPPPTPKTPGGGLKSALKSPGAPPKNMNAILSPTFKEEDMLDKAEEDTDKVQAQDLKIKTRVRMAKFVLRGVNFSCSLIVLSMLAAVFTIFNATKHLPARNGLPAWAPNSQTWPQITLLVIACVSLAMCIIIFYGYYRGGHRRAEKVAVYYTTFAVGFFIFSIIMWGVGAAVLNQSKANGDGKDIWGWSCKDNTRKALFQDDVSYELACRLQNWSLVCCIIEIVVEVFTLAVYGIVFYRFYSKRKLRKSMAVRDRARSDMYLAQLRSQSAPNTPGGPLSPRDGGWRPPPGYNANQDPLSRAEEGEYAPTKTQFAEPQPFQLMPAPSKAKPAAKTSFVSSTPPPSSPVMEVRQAHAAVAQGETSYGAVSIPGAYAGPASPGLRAQQPATGGFDFGLNNQR